MNSNYQEYQSVIRGAINKNEEIRKDISTVIDKGIDNIFFLNTLSCFTDNVIY